MTLDWPTIRDGNADTLHDTTVDITGWMIPLDPQAESVDYFLLCADEPCCGGCVPRNPAASIEVYTAAPLAPQAEALTLRGRLLRLVDDPAGWRYRLVEAAALDRLPSVPRTFSRRAFLSSGAALGLAACAPGRFAGYTDPSTRKTTRSRRPTAAVTARLHGKRRPARSPSTCTATPDA